MGHYFLDGIKRLNKIIIFFQDFIILKQIYQKMFFFMQVSIFNGVFLFLIALTFSSVPLPKT